MKNITIQAAIVATASLMALTACMSRPDSSPRKGTPFEGSASDGSAPDESAPDESPGPSHPAPDESAYDESPGPSHPAPPEPVPPMVWVITNDETLDEPTIERLLGSVPVELNEYAIIGVAPSPADDEAPKSDSFPTATRPTPPRGTIHECAYAVREAATKWARENSLTQVAERQFGDHRLQLLYTRAGLRGIYEVSYQANIRRNFAHCKVSFYAPDDGPVPATATGLSAGNFKEAIECRR